MDEARKILKKYYGYPTFRISQEKVIQSILQGRDTLAIMPTGAGKSICFQIPALLLPGITLVISPLISLMKDQVDALNSLGIAATFINSSLDYRVVEERIKEAKKGKYKLIYLAPERLQSSQFCLLIEHLKVSCVAIDEAHCVSQWGHDFRPSYCSIGGFIQRIPQRPVVAAFTATATKGIKQDIAEQLKLQNPDFHFTGFNRENLFFSVIRGENKKDFLLNYIRDNEEQAGIIYAATRKEVEKIFALLKKEGYAVGKYHAGLSENERSENQEKFLYDDLNIMVATNAFGMGINKSNVRYVIHYNLPKNMEAYYQEAGRAGRDSEPSECILLFSAQDVLLQKYLLEQTIYSPERKMNEYTKLQKMIDYCHTSKCLRKYILEYFGEARIPEECSNCSNCNEESEVIDLTIEAQKIFSCILRMKERYGISLLADVLKGSQNKKVLQLEFHKLSTYAILEDRTLKEIKDLINFLVAEEYISLSGGEYPIAKLEKKAIPVLKSQAKVWHKVIKRKEKALFADSLFVILHGLRKTLANKEKIPPYLIFADSTLREMSQCCPQDPQSFLAVKGVGEAKLEKYGGEFLKVIKDYLLQGQEGSQQIVKKEITLPKKLPKKDQVPSYLITYEMYRANLKFEDIAAKRKISLTTVYEHLIRCGAEGYELDWSDFIPTQYEDLILEKIDELGVEKLKPIKESLPDEVSYLAIKAAIAKKLKVS